MFAEDLDDVKALGERAAQGLEDKREQRRS